MLNRIICGTENQVITIEIILQKIRNYHFIILIESDDGISKLIFISAISLFPEV
jgi:hypothetical protein